MCRIEEESDDDTELEVSTVLAGSPQHQLSVPRTTGRMERISETSETAISRRSSQVNVLRRDDKMIRY